MNASAAAVRRGAIRCVLAAVLFGATTPVVTPIATRTSAPVLAGLLYLGAAAAVAPFLRRPARSADLDTAPIDTAPIDTAAVDIAAVDIAPGQAAPLEGAPGSDAVRHRGHDEVDVGRCASHDQHDQDHRDLVGQHDLAEHRSGPPGPATGLRRFGPLLLAVVFGGLLGPLLLTAGLARTPAATSSLLLNLELVATAVLAAAFFGEHLGRRVVVGSALVTGAGLVLAWEGSVDLRIGSLLVLAACACWGVDNCVTAAIDDLPAATVTFAKGALAGSTNLALGLALGGSLPAGGDLAVAVAAGALGYGCSITLWVVGARDLGAARGQLVFSAAPFFGVAVAWVGYGDPVRLVEVAALALVVAGLSQVLWSDHAHAHAHEPLVHDHPHAHDEHHAHDHGPHPAVEGDGVHRHVHVHEPLVHRHRHVPDLHHRHAH